VDIANAIRREFDGVVAMFGRQSSESIPESQNPINLVMDSEFLNETADDIVETGTQPPAGDDTGGHARWVEIDLLARPYSVLVLGLIHNWFGISAEAAVATQGVFLIAWLILIVLLTLTTLRLPAAFTLLFVLIEIALALVLYGTVGGSTAATTAGGYVTFAFTAVGVYLFASAAFAATGGKPLSLGRPVLN
jgi:hypothetical protein